MMEIPRGYQVNPFFADGGATEETAIELFNQAKAKYKRLYKPDEYWYNVSGSERTHWHDLLSQFLWPDWIDIKKLEIKKRERA